MIHDTSVNNLQDQAKLTYHWNSHRDHLLLPFGTSKWRKNQGFLPSEHTRTLKRFAVLSNDRRVLH